MTATPEPYTISIDRNSRMFAVFDDRLQIVREFQSYQDENAAIAEAKEWVKGKSVVEPKIVYPKITRMTAWESRRR